MGTDDGLGENQDGTDDRFQRLVREFTALKSGEGLSPQKMASAPVLMALLGEVSPVAATQRLLDDLADLPGPDGRALEWALRADPKAHSATTLDARRLASTIPENTAKDRERRAVRALFTRWRRRDDWATSVFTVRAVANPADARVMFGSVRLHVRTFDDPAGDVVVAFELSGPYPPSDFLTIASNETQLLVVYGTDRRSWRLELWLPPLKGRGLRVLRRHPGKRPAQVRVEWTASDGHSVEERMSGRELDDQTALSLDTRFLDPPCPVSWDWNPLPDDPRPAIVFVDSNGE